MKKLITLLLLLPALSAHAEISLIKKMTHAECMQVIRDSLDMYNDMEFCEKMLLWKNTWKKMNPML